MDPLTSYTDYRKLLGGFYESSKLKNPNFSYTRFAQIAGIANRGFLYNVIAGKKKLSPAYIAGIASAMKLSKSESEYFEHLVFYNNARTVGEKKKYSERMNAVKDSSDNTTQPQIVRKDQYSYYSQWFHTIVRSLIGLYGFSGDYEKLARTVNPPITVTQAKQSVALLEKLGFILKKEDGSFELAATNIGSSPEIISLAIHNYHLQSAEIARKVLTTLPRERRNFTAVTLGISSTAFSRVCKELDKFRKRLLKIAEEDDADGDPQGGYQLNLQLFSASNIADSDKLKF